MLRYICIHKLLKFKEMNKPVIIAIIATLVMMISFPVNVLSQEKEKEVKVKTVKMVDGKKVVKDTTFTVKDGENEPDIIRTLSWVSEKDSAGYITIDLEMDSIGGKDGHNNVFIFKSGKDGGKKYKYFFSDDDLKDCEHSIQVLEDFDFEFDESKLKEIELKLAEHKDKLHDMRIKFDGENLVMLKELEKIKEFEELENLEEIIELKHLQKIKEFENIDIHIPEISYFPNHHDYFIDSHHMHDNVSDKELRDAGIKNKPNKLELTDYDITIDDGVVGLSFVLVSEGTPKITVFNYFGDKVFSGKPELMNGKYVIRIDLSAKQNGVYYLQATQKNSSFTKKLRIH